ncbi:hypothetical protein Tco_1117970 [Tanacetum coccineum]
MSENTKKSQCIHCLRFFSKDSNSTLKNHINHPHCKALKRVAESGQSSMSRDGSIFVYNPDVLRERFAGLVIQRGLPFNHFDNEQTTRVFQKHLQPRYAHVSRSTLKRDAMKLWVMAKQEIIDHDLFIFTHGDVESASVIKASLDEFKKVSGLIPSIPKSTAFFCNVLNHVKAAILNFMPFAEGELPVNYLGVPLISSRLLNKDCKVLVEKARNRIGDWKNKSLSYSGRLQLCKSVISSMQVYWASILVIPMGIVSDIQQIIRGFLWCNGEYKRGKAKVAWDDICLPKKEGGLGLRSLEVFNLALMTTHIWNLVSNKESLWVRWINTYKFEERT